MFNLKDAIPDLTTDYILSRISEEQIWSTYCGNFTEINRGFCSELYNDRNPDCRVYYNSKNRLIYKDFGTSDTFDCFSYIQNKYNCTFREALIIIYNDFKLGSMKYDILPQLVLNNAPEVLKMANKSIIEIVPKSWSLVDYEYWNDYGIPLTLLDEYNVYACETVYLHKGGNTITYNYSKNNPIYAYRFCFDGQYSYKIYFPLAEKKKKWLFSGGSENDIEGFDQLPHLGDIIILTKSLKDCMVYNMIGYPAISLQGETNKLKQDLVNKILKRFNTIVVNYDNDSEGIKGAKRLNNQYGFDYFYVDDQKDISDFVKLYGLDEAKKMINNKLETIYG